MRVAGLCILALLCIAAKPGGVIKVDAVDSIEYHYGDSSVPPQYHRSYVISVTAQRIAVVVDSYGDVLARREYSAPKAVPARLMALLEGGGVQAGPQQESRGCTGGTTERIICRAGGRVVLDVQVYHCGGADYGTLRGDIAPFRQAVKALVPDLAKLLER